MPIKRTDDSDKKHLNDNNAWATYYLAVGTPFQLSKSEAFPNIWDSGLPASTKLSHHGFGNHLMI